MARPRPLPSRSRVSGRFSRKNSVSTWSRFSFAMPMPVSSTSRRSHCRFVAGAHGDAAAVAVVLHRVAHQVGEDRCRGRRRGAAPAAGPARSRAGGDVAGGQAFGLQVERPLTAGSTSSSSGSRGRLGLLAARKREQVADELHQAVDAVLGAAEHGQVGVEVVAEALVGGDLDQAADGSQRGLELVHHGADEALLLHGQPADLGDVGQGQDAPQGLALLGPEGHDAGHVAALTDGQLADGAVLERSRQLLGQGGQGALRQQPRRRAAQHLRPRARPAGRSWPGWRAPRRRRG